VSARLSKRASLALLAAAFVVAAFFVFRSYSRQPANAEALPGKRDVPYLDGKWIRYSAEYAKRAEIVFATAEKSSFAPLVSVTGTVTFDAERMAAVGARIAGRVRRILKLEGESVQANDVLAEIESAELGEAQAALVAARAHAEAATANEKREKELADERISARREAELAAANAVAARADLVAAEQKVRALGGSIEGAAGILLLRSPIAGKVIERNVSRGQSVEATHTAFRVADLSRVWVQLAVFERQLSAIRAKDPVDILPQGESAKKVTGSIAHIGDVIDLETRTAPVRVVVDNPEVLLRPGQSVLAKIHTSSPAASSLLLPRAAVTSVDGKPTVFVSHDALSVEPRTVALGGQDAEHIEILSGIEPGERIAVAGVFALKSEIFR
jgi:cobalt-zinc-cadmium efflux system membrane fusion protein